MKKWLRISGWALLLAGGVVMLSFVRADRNSDECWRIDIDLDQDNGHAFVTRDMIQQRMLLLGDSLIGSAMKDIRIDQLQRSLVQMPHVRKAVVTKTLDGRVVAEVQQRIPVARIINPDGSSYYLDSDRRIMPLSENFTANVPLYVTARNLQATDPDLTDAQYQTISAQSALGDIETLNEAITAHPLMQYLTEHVYLDSAGHASIVPRVGSYRIQVGSIRNLEEKFDRLQVFLGETVSTQNLNQYTEINLAYRDQVVCKRRW